jgi:glycosyltransferase involved in cell wall biosynthesis
VNLHPQVGEKTHNDCHRVSVIIPTVQRASIELTKASLHQQTRPADELIIVVDEERRGAAWARNEGVRRSTGDLIAYTDDDCIPPHDWIEQLVRAIDEHDAAGAGGTFQETDLFRDEIRQLLIKKAAGRQDAGNTGNIIYKREWLELCEREDGHIFNTSSWAPSGEDWELVWRLSRRGARIVFVDNPVTHMRKDSSMGYLRHQFGRGVSIAFLFHAQRSSPGAKPVQNSLLWGQTDGARGARWLTAIWQKAVGPFEMRHFTLKKFFWLYWLGSKAEGLGFLWGMVKHFSLATRYREWRKVDRAF